LGQDFMGMLIERTDTEDWYLFSSTQGLLAFGNRNNGVGSAFFIQEHCGYLAAKSCR
jgi:hypothetical protein